jgi:CheY-like chemotaxis protein
LVRAADQPADALAVTKLTVPLDLVVVDDEAKMRTMLQEAFQAIGATVRVAENGEDALALIAQVPSQLVVLDLKLPVMDGFDVLKQLKLRYPQIAVLIISGYYDESIDRFVKELGALAYFHKPLDLPALQRKVAELATRLAAQSSS